MTVIWSTTIFVPLYSTRSFYLQSLSSDVIHIIFSGTFISKWHACSRYWSQTESKDNYIDPSTHTYLSIYLSFYYFVVMFVNTDHDHNHGPQSPFYLTTGTCVPYTPRITYLPHRLVIYCHQRSQLRPWASLFMLSYDQDLFSVYTLTVPICRTALPLVCSHRPGPWASIPILLYDVSSFPLFTLSTSTSLQLD